MSAQGGTKIFGIQLGVDPKIIVGGLIVLSGLLFWFNSRGDDSPASSSSTSESRSEAVPATAGNAAPVPATARAKNVRRNRTVAGDRGLLRIRPVDATHGDIDPTLRLELLARLQSVKEAKPGRSLFEIGPDPAAAPPPMPPVPRAPVIPTMTPAQAAAAAQAQMQAQVNIPLKFYGFVRPDEQGHNNEGLFLEGDEIQVAGEGDLIDHRYLVRELNAFNARIEDTQIKQGQTLQVVPEARPQ